MAASIGADLAEVGVNLNLAPVADVNTNPRNPVIGIRSFGADGELVARHVAASVRGLQSAGVAACAKHFPGHGDTAEDSHHELPVVESLEEAALQPFRAAIEAGVQAIMTAHIVVRSLGETPATMSRELLSDLLREELGYDGLVITDALEMKAISATSASRRGQCGRSPPARTRSASATTCSTSRWSPCGTRSSSAVRSGRLAESRLAEAAERVRSAAAWASRGDRGERVARDVGRVAAERALRIVGEPSPTAPPLVVELEPEPGMAAGRLGQSPGEWFRNVVPGTEIVRPTDGSVNGALAEADGRQVVVVTRDAHRHERARAAIEELVERFPISSSSSSASRTGTRARARSSPPTARAA